MFGHQAAEIAQIRAAATGAISREQVERHVKWKWVVLACRGDGMGNVSATSQHAILTDAAEPDRPAAKILYAGYRQSSWGAGERIPAQDTITTDGFPPVKGLA